MENSNKLIVITGGTKGIGRAIVEKFAQNNFDIVTCSRKEKDLEKLKQEFLTKNPDVNFWPACADLSKREDVNSFLQFIGKLKRQVNILVNNVGTYEPGQVHNEPEDVLEKMISTNLYSAYHLTRGLIGDMIKRKSGHIFNICSTASITPYVDGGAYCISKYALYGMTKVLREEMKEYNVKITAVLPGATLTSSWDEESVSSNKLMKAEDVAEAVFNAYSLSKNTVVEEILMRPQRGDIVD